MENMKNKKSFFSIIFDRQNVVKYLPFVLLLILTVGLQIATEGVLLKIGNIEVLIDTVYPILIISLGATFVYGHGGMDFSVGSLIAVCMLVALTIVKSGLSVGNIILAIVATIATGLFVGFINGLIAAKLKIPAMLGSLAVSYSLGGIVEVATNEGDVSAPIGMTKLDSMTFKVIVLVIIIAISIFTLERTKFGKSLKAIGGNEITSKQAGIPVVKNKIKAYMLCGLFVAIAAIVCLPRTTVVRANTGGTYSINVLVSLLLGGIPLRGGTRVKAWSSVIGCITLVILENGLLLCGLEAGPIMLIKGILFILMVILNTESSKREIVL